jgi:hypothetical protein
VLTGTPAASRRVAAKWRRSCSLTPQMDEGMGDPGRAPGNAAIWGIRKAVGLGGELAASHRREHRYSISRMSDSGPATDRIPADRGTGSVRFTDYSDDRGPCGWIVSPRANISTNFSMRLARVSIFFALPIR